MGIFSEASRHLKDVPFVHEFWQGMYSLSTMSPSKSPISAIGAVFCMLAIHVSASLAR